jgi:hypothetical protein
VVSKRKTPSCHWPNGREEKCIQYFLIGISEEKRPVGRPTHKWEDNIRMDVRERRREVVDWMHVAEDRDQ